MSEDTVMGNSSSNDYSKIDNCTFEGIDHKDYPDYCDAFISSAEWENGTPLTDEELDDLNYNHSDIVYEKLMEHLY